MYKTPPSLNSLCFSHVGCSWRFGALRKTSSRESFCEFFSHFWKSTSCNLHMWRRFVLKSFFVYKYLWGVSRQLSQRRGSEAANYVLDLDLKMQKHCRKTALSTSEHSMKTARHTKWPCFLQPFSGFLHFWPYWHQMRNWGFRFEWIVSVSKQNIDHGAGFGANTSLQCFQRSQSVTAVAAVAPLGDHDSVVLAQFGTALLTQLSESCTARVENCSRVRRK